MTLIEQINQKLLTVSRIELLTAMGYQNLKKSQVRLQELLDAKDIYEWLDNTHYDFRYTNRTFIENLCKVLDVSEVDYVVIFDKYDERKRKLHEMHPAYIFAYTGFKRKSEPVIALCMLEGKRRINIAKKLLFDKTEQEVHKLVSNLIQKHYKASNGELPLWGKIKSYAFYDSDGGRTVYDIKGNVVKDPEPVFESKAELKIGNQNLCKGSE